MKRLFEQYKAIILVALFVLGVNSAATTIMVTGFQSYWATTCNSGYQAGFFCQFNNVIVGDVVGGLAVFLLGYLLFVRWLGVMGARRLGLIALTSTVLFILFLYIDFKHLENVNNSVGQYLDTWYISLLNWSNGLLAALGGALWLLAPGQADVKLRKRK